MLGTPIANNFSGVWGGVIGHHNGTIYIDHAGYASQPGIPVQNGAFYGTRSWTGVRDLRTGGLDSVPGKVTITFVDGDTGATYHAQRNIDYGSVDGSQMFLFDFGGDAVAPTVSVSSPSAGVTVFGTSTLGASASDNVGVAGVQFLVDGQPVGGQLTSAPYTFAWDTTTVADGSHTVQAVAVDAAGNTRTSDSVTVSVVNAPSVSVTSPTAGTAVSGVVAVASRRERQLRRREGRVLSRRQRPARDGFLDAYSVAWNTSGLAAGGSHSLAATVYAANGRTATSVSVPVTIKDTTAPSVSITAPANNSSTSATSATASAAASDNVGVTKVEFYLDGKLLSADTTTPLLGYVVARGRFARESYADRAGIRRRREQQGLGSRHRQGDGYDCPSVSITAPSNNAQVARGTTVTIKASASDNRAVSKVEFSVNNALKCTRTAAPFTCAWAVPNQRGVKYTLTAKVTDSSGITASASVVVTSR